MNRTKPYSPLLSLPIILLFSGLSWKPVSAAYLTFKPRLPVLLSSRVVTNRSFLYKNVLSYCSPCYFSRVVTNKSILYKNALFFSSPCYFSASNGYVHCCNSYPDPRLNGTSFINLSVAYAYCTSVYDSTSHCHVNKLIRYKNALSYCTTCYFSASYGYVHLYNSYQDPPLNWLIFSNLPDTSAYCTSVYSLNKLIRYKNALYYCTT